MPATSTCPESFIETAKILAAASREVIARHFRSRLEVESKSDESPVTIADRETEAALRQVLAERHPEHGIVGEEHGVERADAEFVWVLDPIDGTKSFITGSPLFGTLIALQRDGRPILGMIDMPVLGERWLGAAGHGTTFTDAQGEQEARCRPCAGIGEAMLRTTSLSMFETDPRDLPALRRVMEAVKVTVWGGDCYCYGLLASGFQDLVIEANLANYDFMALIPVIEGAGGIASDWRGDPLGLESDGRVVMAGDPRVHEAALELLAGN
jgi:histidinol phosphatase-like enzyme (inositol monophosphatase family)